MQTNYATLHYTNCTALHKLHQITLHYSTLFTRQLQQLLLPQLQLQLQLHHMTLHCINYTAADYNYKCK